MKTVAKSEDIRVGQAEVWVMQTERQQTKMCD